MATIKNNRRLTNIPNTIIREPIDKKIDKPKTNTEDTKLTAPKVYVVEITLRSGNKSRYLLHSIRHDEIMMNKFLHCHDVYSQNTVTIRTSEIAKYEIIKGANNA